jgi:arylsulfatase A-like enzyme
VADWFPTFAGLAGYRPEKDLKWDGLDRWAILTGAAQAQPRVLYWLGPGGNSLALRQGDLVLIRQKGKPDQLYDLATDPSQKEDLAMKRPEEVKKLVVVLEEVSRNDNDAKVR